MLLVIAGFIVGIAPVVSTSVVDGHTRMQEDANDEEHQIVIPAEVKDQFARERNQNSFWLSFDFLTFC